jgi:hypothetical protein
MFRQNVLSVNLILGKNKNIILLNKIRLYVYF